MPDSQPQSSWVRTHEDGAEYMESLGGVIWHDAPLPRSWHRCRPQTRGQMGYGYTERCACGAVRKSRNGPWLERNETRKSQARKRREALLPRVQVACRTCGNEYEAAEGTPRADARQCDGCWAGDFLSSRL